MKKIDIELPEDWEFVPMEEFYDESVPIGAQIVAARPKGKHFPYFWLAMYMPPQGNNVQKEIQKYSEELDCEPIEAEFLGLEGFVCMVHDFPKEIDYYFLEKNEYILMVKVASDMWDSDGITGWIRDHTNLKKELKSANGNMKNGKPIIVPPALLAQQVSFSQEDFFETQVLNSYLDSYFDFIVANSLRPGNNVEEIVRATEMDYDIHGGIRRIDFALLSKAAQAILAQHPNLYMGRGKTRINSKGDQVATLLIIENRENPFAEPMLYEVAAGDFIQNVSGFIEKNVF